MGLLDGVSFTHTRCDVPSGHLNKDTEPAPCIGWFLLFIVTEVAEQLDIFQLMHTQHCGTRVVTYLQQNTQCDIPFYIFTSHCF